MWDKPVVTIKAMGGTSLAIRWIRLRAPNAGDTDSTPDLRTKIPHGLAWPKKKKKKTNGKFSQINIFKTKIEIGQLYISN